jgi:hypothetical protein
VQRRRAVARSLVRMAPETVARLGDLPKGDALTTAQLAGIMAAKHLGTDPAVSSARARTWASTCASSTRASRSSPPPRPPRRRASRWRRSPHIGGGAHGLRHGEGDRQAMTFEVELVEKTKQ